MSKIKALAKALQAQKAANPGVYKGRRFWSGVFDTRDGQVLEVHPRDVAEKADFHHSLYVSQRSQSAMKDGDAAFFWVDDSGNLQADWTGDKPNPGILSAVRNQLGLARPGTLAATAAVGGAAALAGNDADAMSKIKQVAKAIRARQTVKNAQRNAFPGVYGNPTEIVQGAKVAPESPWLKELFGVTRSDLSQIATSRKGNIENPVLPGAAAKPKGSAAAESIMTKPNEQRLVDVLTEAKTRPDLYEGMTGWYVMDPAYQRLAKLVGEDEAKSLYTRFNTLSGMASPGSDVEKELNRGTAANMLANQGRFEDFARYGGVAKGNRGPDFPPDMAGVIPHPYHPTAHVGPMRKYVESGQVQMDSPKVPMYIQASGVPETGFQTRIPVGDAHWSRGVGLADTRTSKGYDASVSNPEMQQLAPWWEKKVAGEVGLESVPAQALAWGTMGGQTGVKTMIGAPKLEILADQIVKASKRMGISPHEARDLVLQGKAHAGNITPAALAATAGAGGIGVVALRKEDDPRMQPLIDHSNANVVNGQTVHNKDGSESSILTASFTLDNGKTIVVPTIWDGQALPPREAFARAMASGVKWPTFDSDAEAQAADVKMHELWKQPTRADRRAAKSAFWDKAIGAAQALATVGTGMVGGMADAGTRLEGALNPALPEGAGEAQGAALAKALQYTPGEGADQFLAPVGDALGTFEQDISRGDAHMRQHSMLYREGIDALTRIYDELPKRARDALRAGMDLVGP